MNKKIVQRDADPLTLGTPDGIYNQRLFDLCASDSVIGLASLDSYNPALDAIGFVDSNVDTVHEHFLTWVAARYDGDAEAYTSGVATDACAPGETVESGGCKFLLEDWTRLRRASDTRDMTNLGMKYCETQPMYTIAGQRIENDKMWDVVRLGKVILRDMHRQIILGDGGEAAQTDGLVNLIQSTYTDPSTNSRCDEMAGHVVNWGGQGMAITNGQTGATYNGTAIPDGYQLIDVVNSYVQMARRRVQMSSLSGAPKHIALIPTNFMQCLIDAYICYTVCANDITRMDTWEARSRREQLQAQIGVYGTITLTFSGTPITFFPWDYGLYNESTGTGQIMFLVPDVGNTPVIRIQQKNMQRVLTDANSMFRDDKYQATDMGRWLWWEDRDHTCYRIHVENQHRVYLRAPWLQMRITNVTCGNVGLENFSMDPQSPRYLIPTGVDNQPWT